MDIRNLISKFITNIFEKNYSQADKELKSIVEAKVKEKIKKGAKNAKEKATKNKKPDFFDLDKDGNKKESFSKAVKDSKGKNKKNFKKGNKKG
jgi:hypothetical protein